MSYTKRQIVEMAIDAIGLGPDVYTLTPDDVATGIRRLDAMMAAWAATGLRMGYPVTSGPDDADPSSDTGLPDSAVEGVALCLSIKIGPSFGKTVSAETRIEAAKAKRDIDAIFGQLPPIKAMPSGVPLGAGHRRVWPGHSDFTQPPLAPVTRGPNGDTMDT